MSDYATMLAFRIGLLLYTVDIDGFMDLAHPRVLQVGQSSFGF